MQEFEFDLRLPDGRVVTASAIAESWQWTAAFSAACARAERDNGLGAWAGIVCVAYRTTPATAAPAAIAA